MNPVMDTGLVRVVMAVPDGRAVAGADC
jgi:hypothetical protein